MLIGLEIVYVKKTVINDIFSLAQMVEIWLGGLFTPEAYITATRQYVAQANNWSLEELYLDVRGQLLSQTDTCMDTHIHTCIHMHTHTCTYTHAHTFAGES